MLVRGHRRALPLPGCQESPQVSREKRSRDELRQVGHFLHPPEMNIIIKPKHGGHRGSYGGPEGAG